ncbi:MAG: 50S ribosomal protein L24, partial [Marinirhabdus sp.]
MIKLKIKSGDTVVVTAGDHKGSEGKVLRVFREKNKAIVEGVNLVKKHQKPSIDVWRIPQNLFKPVNIDFWVRCMSTEKHIHQWVFSL